MGLRAGFGWARQTRKCLNLLKLMGLRAGFGLARQTRIFLNLSELISLRQALVGQEKQENF